ncbi:MAG: MATE family efflux transporter [Candidatus Krumholzibacteriia bacterium]
MDGFRHRQLMVEGTIDRAVWHLGAPAALAALLQAGFLVVDTFWLGRVGPAAIAAASTAGFVMWLAQTLGEGLANGAGAVLAQAAGADDRDRAGRAAGAGLALSVMGAVVVTGAGLALSGQVFKVMGTAPEVTRAGQSYLVVILAAMPAYFLFAWIGAAFRALGDARTPLLLLGAAAAVNVVLDPLLIFGLGPLPPLGVTGAALATAASWLTAAAVGWRLLAETGLRPLPGVVGRPPREVWQALRVGLPLAVEGALFSLIYIGLTRITTGFGTPAVAALGIGHKLEVLNYFVCAGMGAAATTLVGQNLGAGDERRAARAAWRTLFLTVIPVGGVTALLVAFPEHAVAVFSDAPAVVAAGTLYVLLVGMSQPFMAAEVVLLGAFAGAHRTVLPAALEIGLTAARIPLAAWLVSRGWGVEAVWTAIAATTVIKGSLLAVLFAAGPGRAAAGPGRGGPDRGRPAADPLQ